jgi:low temperature requirement protein LtrA
MIAGTIVTAAADEKILSDPASHASAASATMILAGPALFVAGHAAFTYFIWRRVSWGRVTGIAVLATLAATTRTPPEAALAACVGAVVIAIAILDKMVEPYLASTALRCLAGGFRYP